MTVEIRITSYGTGHNNPPDEPHPVIVDTTSLRNPPDDPDARARLTQLTGLDPAVAAYVMTTPGAGQLVDNARQQVEQRVQCGEQQVNVHVHCYGGRHRSVAIAERLGSSLHATTWHVTVTHRHINQSVLPARPRGSV